MKIKSESTDFNRWIVVNRMPFWVYLRTLRPIKELIKSLLFSNVSILFRKRIEYIQWKQARVFYGNDYSYLRWDFWTNFLQNSNSLPLPVASPALTPTLSQLKMAIIIHAFYPDILLEILSKIGKNHTVPVKLFVTCPPESQKHVQEILNKQSIPFTLKTYPNRGRDVLPFLKILMEIKSEAYDFVLKVHTKKSNHLIKNEDWKRDLFNKLLSKEKIERFSHLLSSNPQIGLIGPKGHILPLSLYYGNNADVVRNLCEKMKLPTNLFNHIHFIAGTMFYAHISALEPILQLDINENDFEEEDAQTDGTLAHAIERAIGAACIKQELYIIDSDSTEDTLSSKATLSYPYAL